MSTQLGLIGLPRHVAHRPFSCDGLRPASTVPLGSSQVQPPWRTSSSEFLCHDLAGAFQRRHARSGFVPHRGVTTGIHFHAKVPVPSLRSALRLSQPLDGLLRLRLRGLVSSRSHVPGSTVQGFLPSRSDPPSSGGSAPLSLGRRPLPFRAPRPTSVDFEALLRAKTHAGRRL